MKFWLEASLNFRNIPIFLTINLINIVIILLICVFVVKPILVKRRCSRIMTDFGEIVDKDRRREVTFIQSGDALIPRTTTYYYVSIKGKVINQAIDNYDYYFNFTLGDKVEIKYTKVYEAWRFANKDKWKFIRNKIKEIRKVK